MLEVLGMVGSIIILFAFTKNGESEIRLYNIVGAAIVCFYGILIGSLTTTFLNGALVVINLWKIKK